MVSDSDRVSDSPEYAIQQAGYLLLELHKLLRGGPEDPDFEKHRAAARRAAERAARSLGAVAPVKTGVTTYKVVPISLGLGIHHYAFVAVRDGDEANQRIVATFETKREADAFMQSAQKRPD